MCETKVARCGCGESKLVLPDGWKSLCLGELVCLDRETLTETTPPDFMFYYLDIGSASQGKLQFPQNQIAFKDAPSRARKVVHRRDVLMSTVRPNLKAFAFFDHSDDTCVASTGFAVLTAKENVDPRFILYSILSDELTSQIEALVVGSNYPAIASSQVCRLRVSAPPLPEQRKIARILTTVDNLIEKTEALIAKYQSVKRGMMHDLFTRGVDEHGHLRPPYEEAPHLYKNTELGWIPKVWCVDRLDNLVEFWDGRRIPLKQEERDKIEGDIPYYGASGIIDYIDRFLFDDELVLLGEDGENVLSRNLPLAFKISGRSWVNNHAHVLKPTACVNIDFLTEYLESCDYSRIVSGSAQPKITQNKLAPMKVKNPPRQEQDRIAFRLKSIAAGIVNEKKGADKLKLLKTALMQDLLTGKVRVKLDEAEEGCDHA